MSRDALLGKVGTYYTDKLRAHGATPRGVDWNSPESQALRFLQFTRLFGAERSFSLNDHGCGYGALCGFLREQGYDVDYRGSDVSAEMLAAARARLGDDPRVAFTAGPRPAEKADYTVASGVYNVRLDVGEAEWAAYVEEDLDVLAASSTRGFGFNALTAYADPDRKRADLHYADPLALFTRCRSRYSRHVALLHDYPLWEFTILVRLP